jgi:hypothetical protein
VAGFEVITEAEFPMLLFTSTFAGLLLMTGHHSRAKVNMRIQCRRAIKLWRAVAGWACVVFFTGANWAGQSGPTGIKSPAQQVQQEITAVQNSMAAMDGKYGQQGIAQTVDSAFEAKQTSAPWSNGGWNAWMTTAWNDVKPFYQSRLATLQAIIQTTVTPVQVAALSADASAWAAKEEQIETLFERMTDKIAQQAVLLNLTKSHPAQRATLMQQAAQLKTHAEHDRATATSLATVKTPDKPRDKRRKRQTPP